MNHYLYKLLQVINLTECGCNVQGDAAHVEVQRRHEIPKIKLTEENIVDILWNGPSCSICLQVWTLLP